MMARAAVEAADAEHDIFDFVLTSDDLARIDESDRGRAMRPRLRLTAAAALARPHLPQA